MMKESLGNMKNDLIKCWCRKCKRDKREDEMFAGVVHPDGIGYGLCKECLTKEKLKDENEKVQRRFTL